jgi:hypothetical protein
MHKKKKKLKKLGLSKETLRDLTASEVAEAVGGMETDYTCTCGGKNKTAHYQCTK